MKRLFTLFLVSLVWSGCGKQSHEARSAELRQKLRKIKTADGISKSEAELIAECYFHENAGCGGFTGIQNGEDFWIVDGLFGYAGTPIKNFRIDKRSGKITSPIGLSYETPLQIFP